MATAATTSTDKDYFIVGPKVRRDNGVIEAIYSLYYLPANYKLILPVAQDEDLSFQIEIRTIIKANALDSRVHFVNVEEELESPEAFASAALAAARIAA